MGEICYPKNDNTITNSVSVSAFGSKYSSLYCYYLRLSYMYARYTFTHLKSDFSATRCMEVLILKRSKLFYGPGLLGKVREILCDAFLKCCIIAWSTCYLQFWIFRYHFTACVTTSGNLFANDVRRKSQNGGRSRGGMKIFLRFLKRISHCRYF